MRSPLISTSTWSSSWRWAALSSPGARRSSQIRTLSFSNRTLVPTPPRVLSVIDATLRSAAPRGKEERMTGVAVVGTGFGCLTHVRGLRAAGFDVLALAGQDPVKTAERARRFDVPHGLTSLADALALPGVDAVTIATPPHTHAPLVLEALAAGRHVLCEKPFARDAAEARALLDAAAAAGVVHLLGTEFRW